MVLGHDECKELTVMCCKIDYRLQGGVDGRWNGAYTRGLHNRHADVTKAEIFMISSRKRNQFGSAFTLDPLNDFNGRCDTSH